MTNSNVQSSSLFDTQATRDERNLVIDRVGVKRIRFPLSVQFDGDILATVGEFAMSVLLPAEQKGTHMSRFLQLLEKIDRPLNHLGFVDLHAQMLSELDAKAGLIEISFPYFVKKTAPVSGYTSMMDYPITVIVDTENGETVVYYQMVVAATSLCPCSKKISNYGAHNQRSHITVKVLATKALAINKLIAQIESCASCQLYAVLKRPDEKYVTEFAYDHPKFVEDLVRDVALVAGQFDGVKRYRVEAENFESIHNHSAYAFIDKLT